MRVREVLRPLVKEPLRRLCRRRELKVSGTRDEILRRLAYSYNGDVSTLVIDLRRHDLLRIASAYSDYVEFPPRLTALSVSELREVCLAVFQEQYTAPEGAAGEVVDNGGDEVQQLDGPDGSGFDIVLHAMGLRSWTRVRTCP